MKPPDFQANQKKDEIADPSKEPNMQQRILKWVLASLPLGGVLWVSFLPLPAWMRQTLVLITLLWFFIFYLLDTFFLNG